MALSLSQQREEEFLKNLFPVAKKTGCHRPWINLKQLSKFNTSKWKTKFPEVSTAKNVYISKLPLRDTYFGLLLLQKSQRLVRFVLEGTIRVPTPLGFD